MWRLERRNRDPSSSHIRGPFIVIEPKTEPENRRYTEKKSAPEDTNSGILKCYLISTIQCKKSYFDNRVKSYFE